MMRVRVRLYATLRAYLPNPAPDHSLETELPEGATLTHLLDQLGLPEREVKVAFVNGRIRPGDWVLQTGDEIGVFPPIGGG